MLFSALTVSTARCVPSRVLRLWAVRHESTAPITRLILDNGHEVQPRELSAPLPAIPSRPTTRPTPWLVPEEMEKYLIPLTDMIPWRAFTPKQIWSTKRNPLPAITNKNVPGNGLIYVARYYFSALPRVEEFVEGVKGIAQAEKHDPSTLETHMVAVKPTPSESETETPTQHLACVRISINTHDAYIPKEVTDSRRSQYPAKDVTLKLRETSVVPGLTMRDVRFAMLVDELYRNQFADSLPSFILRPSSAEPLTVQQLLFRIFRARFCPCCGLPHTLMECTLKDEYKPNDGSSWADWVEAKEQAQIKQTPVSSEENVPSSGQK